MDELKQNKCDRVRVHLSEIADAKNDLAKSELQVDGEPIYEHVENCSPCRSWQVQTNEILDMARSLPQFDVSERLTQNILSQVAQEDRARQQQLGWVVYAIAIGLFLYVMLFVDAFESVWGIGSWIVGLATMIGLKLLISEPQKERQVV